jgi:hypothetical protein
MTLYHFPAISGHVGTQRLTQTIYRAWYWPSLSKDLAEFIKRCPSCAAQRLKRGPQRSHKLTIFPPEGPLEFVAIDVLGPLPKTKRVNRFCMVMCDRFSKVSIAVPIPDQTANTCAQVFVDRWICYYGVPLVVIGSTYQWPCIDRPCIDMPRLGSTSRGHISICHVFHCHVNYITIRDGTITPRIPLPCHPHPQYVMAPSRHVFHCYHSLHRARKTSCHKFTHSRVIFQITLGDSVIDASL